MSEEKKETDTKAEKGKWHGGKGSKRRKENKKKIDANWDVIFKKNKEEKDADEAEGKPKDKG